MDEVLLPYVNESGYYEMRLESIGGLGANLCGKLLGELGIRYMGLNSASFASYGSEKTGTPVKSYIRYGKASNPIRTYSAVRNPHVLGIFHEALLNQEETLAGCGSDTQILLNTEKSVEEAAKMYGIPISVLTCIPAQKIAMECHSRINMVMLGAMGRLMGFVELEWLEQMCKDTLGNKYPDALAGNLQGIQRGFRELNQQNAVQEEDPEKLSQNVSDGEEPSNAYKTDQQGSARFDMPTFLGGVNPYFGNSVKQDVSASRQGYFPLFRKEKCINCGMCDTTCPDMVFQFRPGEYKGRKTMVNMGLDYYHCKGCLRCVAICPSEALVQALEKDYPQKPYFMPNQDMIRQPEYYQKAGADGYITSEAYLTEERFEGGEV